MYLDNSLGFLDVKHPGVVHPDGVLIISSEATVVDYFSFGLSGLENMAIEPSPGHRSLRALHGGSESQGTLIASNKDDFVCEIASAFMTFVRGCQLTAENTD